MHSWHSDIHFLPSPQCKMLGLADRMFCHMVCHSLCLLSDKQIFRQKLRPAYPKILLSILWTAYVRIFTFLTGFLRMHPQSVKTLSKVNFSITHLVRTVCELTSSIIQTQYTRMTFCLHLQKSFSIRTAEHFLQKQCTMCAAFADADVSFLEWLLSGRSLFPWFCAFFLLFVSIMQPYITDSYSFKFKPSI